MDCTICRFPAELDDVALGDLNTRFICVRCFNRTAESEKPMPKPLRRLFEQALSGIEETAA
jgi:hypothetical protein